MNLFRCPRCHQGKLYKGLLTIAESCSACGQSFAGHEQGDGPAVLSIFIVGAITTIGAAIVEIKYSPPFLWQAAFWIPFVVIGSIFSLRVFKAALIATQYRVRPEDFTKEN
jgi:uncharacterized protein (DUF983 family)